MRKAKVYNFGELAGILSDDDGKYTFKYLNEYKGYSISLTMPREQQEFTFSTFPAFFDGLLPEGNQLEALLKTAKLDRHDLFGQLVTVGQDLVGSVTLKALSDE